MNTIQLCIENFKRFKKLELTLGKMNVVCGTNGVGKSSLIQALLLYMEAIKSRDGKVFLNASNGLELGTVGDLIHAGTPDSDHISVSLAGMSWPTTRPISPPDKISFLSEQSNHESRWLNVDPPLPEQVAPGSCDMVYIQAERTGARLYQQHRMGREAITASIGVSGEFVAEILEIFEMKRLHDSIHQKIESRTLTRLKELTEYWLSMLFGPWQLRVQSNNDAPPSLYFRRSDIEADEVLAPNTGFGLSYALPIIVGGLITEQGGMLIVDSPEAHLHPAAQTQLALFLCRIAASGVCVVIETHSDHIVDGVRLAAASGAGKIEIDDVFFQHFSEGIGGDVSVELVKVQKNGRLSTWPPGFFDQQSKNLKHLAELSRMNP